MKNSDWIAGFKKEKLKQWFLYWLVLGVGFLVLMFLITSTWIGVDVRERCLAARSSYGGDCVEALVRLVEDNSRSYRERNFAIWALGQLGDDRAKPTIIKHYTGLIPKREPYDSGLSQYEMKKALALLNGGLNITHLVWNPVSFVKLVK